MPRAVRAWLLLMLILAPAPARAQGAAKVTFVSPTEGATVAGPQVEVQLAFEGFRTVRAGTPVKRGAEGHAHLFIDAEPGGPNTLIPIDLPTVVHLGAPPFEARSVKLSEGTHSLTAVLGDSAHRTFHRPATAKVTFTVAPGFRGKGPLEPGCGNSEGSVEMRVIFPLSGGTLQGLVEGRCAFAPGADGCTWQSAIENRLLGSYEAESGRLSGQLTGTSRRTLLSGDAERCGPPDTIRLPTERLDATFDGRRVAGSYGGATFELREDQSVVLTGPITQTGTSARDIPWLLIALVAGGLGSLGALALQTRRRPKVAAADALEDAVEDADTLTCDRCGASLRTRSRFCSSCGTALMAGRDSGSGAAIAPAPPSPSHVFSREGEFWTITFSEATIRMKDSKGVRHLAHLLANPGREYHVLDLVAAEEGHIPDASDRGEDLVLRSEEGVEVLDAEAKAAYRRRLADLEDELTEAESWGDAERASRLREEADALRSELAAGVGLGGRDRKASSPVERARWSVTRAIRSSLQKIAESHPSLGEHLSSTVKTGTFCSYTPDPRAPITWSL